MYVTACCLSEQPLESMIVGSITLLFKSLPKEISEWYNYFVIDSPILLSSYISRSIMNSKAVFLDRYLLIIVVFDKNKHLLDNFNFESPTLFNLDT